MPSLSGLHMWRTISSGHSSRSSSSRSTSSGRRFLAKSLSDFKLNFSVLAVIMFRSSLCRDGSHFADFVSQLRQEFQDVVDNSDVCHLKDWSFGILVNRDQKRTAFKASQMLESAADATRQINFGLDSFARRAHLA